MLTAFNITIGLRILGLEIFMSRVNIVCIVLSRPNVPGQLTQICARQCAVHEAQYVFGRERNQMF